jgi:hypothetical protein
LKSKTSKSSKQPLKPKFTRYEKLTTVPLPLVDQIVRKPNKKEKNVTRLEDIEPISSTEIIKDPNTYESSDPVNLLYLIGGTILLIGLTVFCLLFVTGCTYNVSMAHTSGIASHVIEESETDTVDPKLSVPAI